MSEVSSMGLIARRVPRWCDWLIRTFAADEPMRHGGAASAWAWERLMAENEELRRERQQLQGAVEENERLREALRNVGRLVEGTHQPHDTRRMVREVVNRHAGGQ